jgi:methionine-rich copper-binding protein CopC
MSVGLAAMALLVGAATTAQAHNVLVTTSPADGSMVEMVPSQVMLTFNQPALALGTIVVVTGPAGHVQRGAAVLVDNNVTEHLQPGSPAGRYTVAWRVTSADGHPVSGQFSFTAKSASRGHRAAATHSTAVAAGGQATTHWWVMAVGIFALLLIAVLVIRGKPRETPPDEMGPEE